MAHYDKRFGYVGRAGIPSVLGGMGSLGMGALTAEQIATRNKITASIAASGNGAQYKTWAETYTRLSKKDKDKQTLAAAKELASYFNQKYASYLASRTPVTPVTPVPPTPIPDPGPVTPIPYVPIDYGGGGGGGGGSSVPETVPIVQTGQYTANGQPIFYNQSTNQSFYYDASGQPVYYDPTTGQWGVSSQALTPIQYVQMPDGSQMTNQYGQAVDASGQIVDASGQPVSAAQAAAYSPVQYVQMPDGSEQSVPQGGGSIDEISFVGSGRAEYSDQWGPIRVIRLVIPKKTATATPAATATAPVAQTAVQTSPSVYGGQALPGGTMNVEDFTSQYALEGGQW